jgi:hypothetical protein
LTEVALVPESQLWTLEEPHRSAIAEGLAWAAKTPPAESDLDALLEQALKHPFISLHPDHDSAYKG